MKNTILNPLQKKEQAFKRVHLFGRLYILLGVLDLFMLVASMMGEKEEIIAAFAANGLSPQINYGFLAAISFVTVVTAGIKIYVGIQGTSCTEEKKMKKSCITLAKVLMVLSGLSCLAQFLAIFTGSGDWIAISSAAVTLLLLFCFVQSAEELR